MDIHSLSKTFYVRRLDRNDVELIHTLCSQNHLFYQYHPPFVTKESILEDMKALPPAKQIEDKYYIGFFGGNTLVAVMDMILGYPEKEYAYIGFFMTDIRVQNKGIGSKIIREAVRYLKASCYRKIRLGVDKGNPQSYAFWEKNGFTVIGEDEYILMELIM